MCVLRPHTKKGNKLMPIMFALQLPGDACPGGNMAWGLPCGQSWARTEEECLAGAGFSLDASRKKEAGLWIHSGLVLMSALLFAQSVPMGRSLEGQSLCVPLRIMGTMAASSDLQQEE